MRIVIAITIVITMTITTATTPPIMATVLSEFELAVAAAVCGDEVVIEILPSGPTGAAYSGKCIDHNYYAIAFAQNCDT